MPLSGCFVVVVVVVVVVDAKQCSHVTGGV